MSGTKTIMESMPPNKERWACIVEELYAHAKILEGRTNRSERGFEALFKGVSTRFGPRNVEKCVKKTFRTACSTFQNLLQGRDSRMLCLFVSQVVLAHLLRWVN
jgi:hypothetical protein